MECEGQFYGSMDCEGRFCRKKLSSLCQVL